LASYVTSSLSLGDLTLLGEFKYYNDFILRAANSPEEPYALLYHQPPTLERVRAELTDNLSVGGFRLRADYNLGQRGPIELLVFASYSYFRSWGDPGLHAVHDPHAGFELQWQGGSGHLNLTSGVRHEIDRKDGELYRQEVHLELEFEQALAKRHSLKAYGYYQRRKKHFFSGISEWHELDSSVEWKWSPYVSAAFTFELTGDQSVVGDAGHTPYFGGSLRYFLTASTYISLRAGQNRPGLKCINGICRVYPGFSGVQVMAVGRL
jgi:hypothetical protein